MTDRERLKTMTEAIAAAADEEGRWEIGSGEVLALGLRGA
jgi:hypothetical protein